MQEGRVEQIFNDALDVDVSERGAYVESRCGDEAELLAEVRELRKHLVVLRDGIQLRVSERHWVSLQNALGM